VAKSALGEVGTTTLTFTFHLFILGLRLCLCILPVAAEDENSFRKESAHWWKSGICAFHNCIPDALFTEQRILLWLSTSYVVGVPLPPSKSLSHSNA